MQIAQMVWRTFVYFAYCISGCIEINIFVQYSNLKIEFEYAILWMERKLKNENQNLKIEIGRGKIKMKITDCSKTALIMMRVWDEDFGRWGADISGDYFESDIQGRFSGSDAYIVGSVDRIIECAREWEAEKPADRIAEIYFLGEHYSTNDTVIWF